MSLQKLDLKSHDKDKVIEEVRNYFTSQGFKITREDLDRPWGFFYYFDPSQTKEFAEVFFQDVELTGIDTNLPLQPKVLVFAPGQLNSWQYHHRRAEIWRVITSSMVVAMSDNDDQPPLKPLQFGDVVNFAKGMRHRGGATKDEWGAVAEIWQHTDAHNPSDEDDIVRLQDDYDRS